MQNREEFKRQIGILLQKGYPKLANISLNDFSQLLEPLRSKVETLPPFAIDNEKGRISFVIVFKNSLIPAEKAMSQIVHNKKEGVVKLYPHDPTDFTSTDDVVIPEGMAYLLIDVDRGKETINIPPNEALKKIKKANRSPLTIDEGIAILTQFPDFLMKNNCFSLLASRHKGDQRVPAIWINANKNPNLGWCWDGNPHTWLGSASCKSRIGI